MYTNKTKFCNSMKEKKRQVKRQSWLFFPIWMVLSWLNGFWRVSPLIGNTTDKSWSRGEKRMGEKKNDLWRNDLLILYPDNSSVHHVCEVILSEQGHSCARSRLRPMQLQSVTESEQCIERNSLSIVNLC